MLRAALSSMLVMAALLSGATQANADATLSCVFRGKTVQVVIANTKDGPRACNAVCIWRYPGGLFRGLGGAALEGGESKSAFNGTAPAPVEAVHSSNLSCNR